MTVERLEMRLSGKEHLKLEVLAQEDASLSDAVRRLIDEAYEVVMHAKRLEAVERIASANVGPLPEPSELKDLVDEAASSGDFR